MTVTIPESLKQPVITGMNLIPKKRNINMTTEEGRERIRSYTLGDVYVVKCELRYNTEAEVDEFDEFLKYSLNYGQDWFFADWFVGWGFTADSFAFKFEDIQKSVFGYKTVYPCTLMIQPKADADLPPSAWPDTRVDPTYEFFRFGVISPASLIDSTADSTHVTLEAGEAVRAKWRTDWAFITFDLFTGERLSGPHTITDVTNETLTFTPATSPVALVGNGIKFANYDEVDDSQKIYAFITDDENDFPSDSGLAYRITYG